MKSHDEVEDCHLVSIVELAITDNLNNYCNNKEIKATTFEELKDEDAAIACITWLKENQPMRTDKHFKSFDLSNKEVKSGVPSIE